MIPTSLQTSLSRTDSFAVISRKILSQQWTVIQEHLETGLFDMPAIHQMRVAVRRMRTWLRHCDLCKGALPAEELKAFANRLGGIRDLDTCLRTFEIIQEIPDIDVKPLVECIHAQRTQERVHKVDALRQYLGSSESIAWRTQLSTWLHSESEEEMDGSAGSILQHSYMDVMGGKHLSRNDSKPMLHRHRVRCKRLRYNAEFLQPLLWGSISPIHERALRFQNVLGTVQDYYRDLQWLDTPNDEGIESCKAKCPDASAELVRVLDSEIENHCQVFFSEWEEFILPENQIRYEYLFRKALGNWESGV